MRTLGSPLFLSLTLLLAMLLCLEFGYRAGRRASAADDRSNEGVGAIDAALFALLGLLLGFAFAGAMSRFDARRQLIVREANATRTAYLRLDLLPGPSQAVMRQLFRDYLGQRLLANRDDEIDMADPYVAQSAQRQQQIWTQLISVARDDPSGNTARIVVPAVNEMIEVTTARTIALTARLPRPILVLLMTVALAAALIAGFQMARRPRRSFLHGLLFASIVAVTVFVVLDLDDPGIGLIRLDAAEDVLRQLHDSIR
jgi:hypothetical protein